MLLALDTATRVMGLALHSGQDILCEQSWRIGNRHTIELAPAVDRMLKTSEVTPDQLTGIGVCNGPGSYTGVRIGVALAKGMAASRSLPLVGMSSLDLMAAGQPYYQSGAGLIAVVQAGRGRIIVKSYRWRKGEWYSRSEPRLMDWDELLQTVDGTAYITGEINQSGLEAITQAQQNGVPVTAAPPAQRIRRAGYLAEYALGQLQTGEMAAFAPSRLLPVYVKTESA
jgi:tRNA threonylcarbamoyladenosine biosynthesis protein TsaB